MLQRKGSITIYFSLMMLVLTSLIMGMIVSVKVSAGRMQAANSVDQAMFSLFANYDRELSTRYDLFFLHTGGEGGAGIGACISYLEEAMEYILKPSKDRLLAGRDLLRLERTGSAVTAYTLATDAGGIPFEAQAVQAARQTAALGAVDLLKEKMTERESVEQKGQELLSEAKSASYGDVQQAAEEAAAEQEEAESSGGETEHETVEVPEGFVNPLPSLYRLYRRKVMEVVVPDPGGISGGRADRRTLPSGRMLNTGMGIIDGTGGADGLDNLYYLSWVISHFGTYAEPVKECALAYQMEYLLKGKASDRENLQAVIGDLMKVRQAANMLCLYTDAEKSAELSLCALFIATMLGIPAVEPVVKVVLAALWAYAESLVDVRALLEGKKVAIAKSRDTWQTDPEDLAASGGEISGMTRDAAGGTSYSEYLGTFILVMHRRTLTQRAMDMVESTIRGCGREAFRLDACIGAMAVEMTIRSEGRVSFPVSKELTYTEL